MTDGMGGEGSGDGGNGGGEATTWTTGLDDAGASYVNEQGWKGAADAVKAHQELSGKVGSMVALPGEGATPQDYLAVMDKMGRPSEWSGYELAKPENLPEGMPYSEDLVTGFKQVAHEQGFLPHQVQALHDWWNNLNIKTFNDFQAESQKTGETNEKLAQTALGQRYDQSMTMAERTLRSFAESVGTKLGNKEFATKAAEEFAGLDVKNTPYLRMVLAAIGEKFGDALPAPGQNAAGGQPSPLFAKSYESLKAAGKVQ